MNSGVGASRGRLTPDAKRNVDIRRQMENRVAGRDTASRMTMGREDAAAHPCGYLELMLGGRKAAFDGFEALVHLLN